jgi:exodeoxyribonuclease V beta subunit
LEGGAFERHKDEHVVEERGEDLRLAYVALTRAQHQAVLWWAGSWDSRHSPLGRLLFARDDEGNVAPSGAGTPDDATALARFEALAAAAPGRIRVERSVLGMPGHWSTPPVAPAELAAAVFDRDLDARWRRTSYSDISAGTHDVRVASEPEEPLLTDEPGAEPAPAAAAGPPEDPALGAPSPLRGLPAGVHVGTLVHRVLEATDFAAADLDAELAARLQAVRARRAVDVGDPAALVAGLCAAIETPLGPLVDGARLRDVARADRLDELDFELPLTGGDDPTGRLALATIAGLLHAHLRGDDPLARYPERLEDPALRPHVRGYLAGSLDLVVRLPGAGGIPRFAVIDYKTNWLGGADGELTIWHHRPSALAAEMRRRHYGLQALLYTAALHRYLRWRVPGYDVERHFAGVLYLFLRGMAGRETPTVDGTPYGVFAWRPPAALVNELSDALDRGTAA